MKQNYYRNQACMSSDSSSLISRRSIGTFLGLLLPPTVNQWNNVKLLARMRLLGAPMGTTQENTVFYSASSGQKLHRLPLI